MNSLTPLRILVAGSLLVLALWLAYAFIALGRPIEKWGLFGDKFGALNCLFTGLAFVGLIAALWHERGEAEARNAEQTKLLRAMHAQVRAATHTARVQAVAALLREKNREWEKYYGESNSMGMGEKARAKMQSAAERIIRLEEMLDSAAMEQPDFLKE